MSGDLFPHDPDAPLLLGQLAPDEAAERLEALGDEEAARELEEAAFLVPDSPEVFGPSWWPFHDRPWQHGSVRFGFVEAAERSPVERPLFDAEDVDPDPDLPSLPLVWTLAGGRLDLPGRRERLLMITLEVEHRERSGGRPERESRHPSTTVLLTVRGSGPTVVPSRRLFVGARAGAEGAAIRGTVTMIHRKDDRQLLASAARRPAAAVDLRREPLDPQPLVDLGVIERRNTPVHRFEAVLQSSLAAGPRLAPGQYLPAFLPSHRHATWDWEPWCYDPRTAEVVRASKERTPLAFNYLRLGLHPLKGG